MKVKNLYKISALLLGILVMSSCVKWEEFTPSDLAAAPTASIALVSAADSTIVVDVTNSADGFVTVVLLEGVDNTLPEDPESLLTGNVTYTAMASGEHTANTAVSYTFTGLYQDMSYEVMAVAANTDGVVSEVAVLAVATDDTYPPHISDIDPGSTYNPVLEKESEVVVYFDEYITLGTGSFTFEGFYSGMTVDVTATADDIDANTVTLTVPADFPDKDYIWLHMGAGAVKDYKNNEVAAFTTYFDGDAGAFVGIYWRLLAVEKDVEVVAPDVAAAQDAGFDIVLTYPESVDVSDVADGDITLTYDNGAGVVTVVDVPAADVTASGASVTISQTVFAALGGTVTVDIPAELFSVGLGNPSAEFSATWTINTVVPL